MARKTTAIVMMTSARSVAVAMAAEDTLNLPEPFLKRAEATLKALGGMASRPRINPADARSALSMVRVVGTSVKSNHHMVVAEAEGMVDKSNHLMAEGVVGISSRARAMDAVTMMMILDEEALEATGLNSNLTVAEDMVEAKSNRMAEAMGVNKVMAVAITKEGTAGEEATNDVTTMMTTIRAMVADVVMITRDTLATKMYLTRARAKQRDEIDKMRSN